jgi:hypothetical protein
VFFKPARGWGARCKPFHQVPCVVLHRARGRWRIRQLGGSTACVAVNVPADIRRDLRIPCYPLLP